MSNTKNIALIPPNGKPFINDFSIQRLGDYFKDYPDIHTTLLIIDMPDTQTSSNTNAVIYFASEEELFKHLSSVDYDVIFHRSWMLAYPFAAKLVQHMNNVIVNIKDWNFSTQKEYKIIFGENAVEDFNAIKYIFQHAKAILSHYTDQQAKIWAKKYNVDVKKFIFFPEYCNEKNFNYPRKRSYQNPKLAFAGSLGPTSYPEEFFLAKSHLRALRQLTQQNIDVSYVLTQGAYAGTQSPRQRLVFQDILYENAFNEKFHITKGETLNSSILEPYHFGFFILEYSTKSVHLNRYAIPSKFAFYLEAGLPMLINANMKALAHLIQKYNLGIVFNNSHLDNFSTILDISEEDYLQMVRNIIEFRRTKYQYNKDTLDTIIFNDL